MHPWTHRPIQPSTRRSIRSTRRFTAAAVLALAVTGLAGCATAPQLQAQWSDPALSQGVLRGARVLVACDASEFVLRRICQDRVAADVAARGATPIFPGPDTLIATDRSVDNQLLPAAREAGASALLVVTVAVAVNDVSPGFSVGIGGFGFGRGSGIGASVAAPIGGGSLRTGYSANARVTEVRSGRLAWTAKATSAPSSDVNAQLAELSRTVVAAADQAGLF